jgi:hypothetical protein
MPTADTVGEPQRGELKAALREYTADRVQLLSGAQRDQIEPLLAKVSGLHERMWRFGVQRHSGQRDTYGARSTPINEVIDLHSTHLAYGEKTSAASDYGGADGHGGHRRRPIGLRQRSCGSAVFHHGIQNP